MLINTKSKHKGLIEYVSLILILAFAAGIFVQHKVLWRWDNLLYDTQLSYWSREVPQDIIIVAIDDESLNQLGRWPWSRATHAQLIELIEQDNPKVIGFDLLFSEKQQGNSNADAVLSEAIKKSGKVVLPLYMSQQSYNSFPIESLPLPEFTTYASALGHVHLDISEDGIARKVFLKEGIGQPQWPHFGVAILNVVNVQEVLSNNIEQTRKEKYSPMLWAKEVPFLIPYAGPTGYIKQIGYSQVLAGNYQKDLFRDKIVLVGATAEGLGDAYPTPFSGHSGNMPGVEIIAHIIDALQRDIVISELNHNALIALTILLVALPLIIYPYLNPGSTLIALFGIILLTVTIINAFLYVMGLWVPLSTVILFQLISFPLWSWRRLEFTMRHITNELDHLTSRLGDSSIRSSRNIADEIKFISEFIPINSWELQDQEGLKILGEGNFFEEKTLVNVKTQNWVLSDGAYWAKTYFNHQICRLGLKLDEGKTINDETMVLLNSLLDRQSKTYEFSTPFSKDILQTKINKVQAAGNEYEALRGIIDNSLTSMADGVLICNNIGQIMLSNQRACWYIYGDDNAQINGKSLTHIFELVELTNDDQWNSLLEKVLLKQDRVLAHSQHKTGRDLMIELSPLVTNNHAYDGFIINFSDISLLKASERKRNELLDFLSHDLRSPLSSMLAMIEITKNKSSLEEMKEMLDLMEKNTHKTLHLAEQFLQLSRANTTENLSFYEVDFHTIVLNAIDQIWALSNKQKVTIEHFFEQEECWIYAEADLLERAILNLLSNAIKHSPEGSTVTVAVYEKEHDIGCCVIDKGTGIAAEELPTLFNMFQRTRDSGIERKLGVGLGLAFVDAVINQHSGSVEVESELGEGSTFCFTLPKNEQQ